MRIDHELKLRYLRKKIIETATNAQEGHIPSSLSILDLLWVLYTEFLGLTRFNCESENRNRFVLSKGHASLALYAMLLECELMSEDEFNSFGKYSSLLGGHPDTTKLKGVEASTGSLGHGFPIAVGNALAQKIKKINAQTFCLIGDGEANEGSVWEAALLAAHHQLNHLTLIIDFNHSTDRALQMGDLVKKFESFGFEALSINGHTHSEIRAALSKSSSKPKAIIAETIKGYGCKPLENNPAWHHKFPSPSEMLELMKELR